MNSAGSTPSIIQRGANDASSMSWLPPTAPRATGALPVHMPAITSMAGSRQRTPTTALKPGFLRSIDRAIPLTYGNVPLLSEQSNLSPTLKRSEDARGHPCRGARGRSHSMAPALLWKHALLSCCFFQNNMAEKVGPHRSLTDGSHLTPMHENLQAWARASEIWFGNDRGRLSR